VSPAPASPLASVRVLDLSSVGPASRCTRILADYGAEVVKVGPPPRKGSKQIEPPFFSYAAGRGMRRTKIDLAAPAGREAFLRLASRADVVIESYRPGVAARLGIGYEDVRARSPRVVYCSTSGYGQAGPYAGWAGHDLNYLALGGYLDCSSPRADGGPPIPGASVADSAAGGMQAAIAILAALLRRGPGDEGAYLDVSVADGVLQLMSLHIDEYLATGTEPGPGSNLLTGRYACYELYRARDGGWLAVAAIEPAFYANLCRALGCEHCIPHQLDDARQDEIRDAFRQAFARRDRDAWVAELAPADTCVTPVYTVPELTRDPHFAARGAFTDARHPERGRFRQVGPVLAGSPRSAGPCELPGSQQTDTGDLLGEAGLRPQEIEKLRAEGVVA
jgi:crotonobetainyl-CoA:carnitine CoA-transferase CaiB-like acyl-CoA transferase